VLFITPSVVHCSNMQSLMAWNPDAAVAKDEEQQQQQQRQQQPGHLPSPPRPGKRLSPGANQSNIIFG
jgi:hypothetical protein